MRRYRRLVSALFLSTSLTGCHGGPQARTVASAEPALVTPAAPGTTIASVGPERTVTFVDRHPLFSKPREYYESSGDNRLVKGAAAVFVGIPVGFVREMRQIVVGAPPQATY